MQEQYGYQRQNINEFYLRPHMYFYVHTYICILWITELFVALLYLAIEKDILLSLIKVFSLFCQQGHEQKFFSQTFCMYGNTNLFGRSKRKVRNVLAFVWMHAYSQYVFQTNNMQMIIAVKE